MEVLFFPENFLNRVIYSKARRSRKRLAVSVMYRSGLSDLVRSRAWGRGPSRECLDPLVFFKSKLRLLGGSICHVEMGEAGNELGAMCPARSSVDGRTRSRGATDMEPSKKRAITNIVDHQSECATVPGVKRCNEGTFGKNVAVSLT